MRMPAAAVRTFLLLSLIRGLAGAQTVQAGTIDVGPDTLYYETAGSGPVVVLIHDGIVPCPIWDGQFLEFAKSHKVVRYDRRGYGRSSAPTAAYSHVEDLKVLFDRLDLEPAVLMGMSSGGRLCVDFTLRYPEKVRALVLVGAVIGGFSYTDHFLTRGGHRPADLNDTQSLFWYVIADDPYEIYPENKAAREKVKDIVRKYPFRPGTGAESEPPGRPSYERLGEIKVPALILAGEFDMPDVHAHAGALNAGIAKSRRAVIAKSGHLIPMEQPGLFNAAALKFLKDLS